MLIIMYAKPLRQFHYNDDKYAAAVLLLILLFDKGYYHILKSTTTRSLKRANRQDLASYGASSCLRRTT
jgi:hypothetical protein